MKKYLLIHVLCGLLAVYLSGIVDREQNVEGKAPCLLLFITGPLGLAMSVGAFVVVEIEKQSIGYPFERLYRLGYGKK